LDGAVLFVVRGRVWLGTAEEPKLDTPDAAALDAAYSKSAIDKARADQVNNSIHLERYCGASPE
jgi:hypothetical protein